MKKMLEIDVKVPKASRNKTMWKIAERRADAAIQKMYPFMLNQFYTLLSKQMEYAKAAIDPKTTDMLIHDPGRFFNEVASKKETFLK